MKRINSLARSEYVSNVILGLIFLFPVLPFNFVSVIVITLIIAVIIEKVISKELQTKNYNNLIYSGIFYFILLVTLSYSDNLNEGLKEAQKSLPIFLFPLIFFLKKELSRFNIKIYLLIFIFANFAFIIFLYRYFLINFFLGCHYDMSLLPIYIKIQYIYNKPFYELMWCSEKAGESFLFVHKVYNSMFLLFCNASIIYLLKQFKFTTWMKTFLVVLFILFSAMIINMVSLVNVFLFLILTPTFLLFNLDKKKRRYLLTGLVLFFVVLIGGFIVKKDSLFFITKEISWIFNQKEINSLGEYKANERMDLRFYINSCSLETIKKHPIFGVGIGDVQDIQNNCYQEKAITENVFSVIYEDNLNAHNQYFTFLKAGGFILLIAFLLILFNNFRKEYQKNNYLYLFFLILIICNLFFESMFTRMYGVIFFSLFYTILRTERLID